MWQLFFKYKKHIGGSKLAYWGNKKIKKQEQKNV